MSTETTGAPVRFARPMLGIDIDRLVREYAGSKYISSGGYGPVSYVTPGIVPNPFCGFKFVPGVRDNHFLLGSLNDEPLPTYSAMLIVVHQWPGRKYARTLNLSMSRAMVDWCATGIKILLATGDFYR